jgi:hypothetical protein
MNLYEVTYTLTAIIVAKSKLEAEKLAVFDYEKIVNDVGYDSKKVEPLPIHHNWDGDYYPYGDNPMNYTLDQLILREKLGFARKTA